MKSLHKFIIVAIAGMLMCGTAFAADETEISLPYLTDSSAEFSSELPVSDLLVGDTIYINFEIGGKENLFAFEAEIEYDGDMLSFSSVSSEDMDVTAASSESDGTVKFAASMLGGNTISGDVEINLIFKAKTNGSAAITLKSAILVYDDMSYTEFDGIDESVTVKVKKTASSSSSSGSSSGSSGGSSSSSSSSGGSIAVQATATPTPTYIAEAEENAEEDALENVTEFNDLDGVEWAREAIEALSAKNIINGIGEGLFNPSGKITRAEFAKIITLACGISTEGAECVYSDVPSDEWYYPYVAAATENSLLNGYISGEFRPNGYITREEAAVVCARTIEQDDEAEILAPEFRDKSEISDFAYDSVCLLSTLGIINGDENGNFNPSGNLSRAEAAKIIYLLTGGGE